MYVEQKVKLEGYFDAKKNLTFKDLESLIYLKDLENQPLLVALSQYSMSEGNQPIWI